MKTRRAKTNEEIQEAIAAGRAYLDTAWGQKRVIGYRHDTGWAVTGSGMNQRSFMVCVSDVLIEEPESKLEVRVDNLNRQLTALRSAGQSCADVAATVREAVTLLLTWRDEMIRLRTGGVVALEKPTCKYCGQPSDPGRNQLGKLPEVPGHQ